MDGADPSEIDVTIAEPGAIAQVVADVLVGRCVRLTWSSRTVDDGEDATLGVTSAAVEVVGCWVAEPGEPPQLVCVHADDDEFLLVSWSDLLGVGRRFGGDVSPAVQMRLTEVSRWFGHTVEITNLGGHRLIGTVIGFEYDGAAGSDDVDLLVVPLDHVRHPQMNEYSIPTDQLDTVLDWGT